MAILEVNILSSKWIKINCFGYVESYKLLMSKNKELSESMDTFWSAYFYPAMTVSSFAVELALKSILEEQANYWIIKDELALHNLYKLFCRINGKTQNQIIKKVSINYDYKSLKLGSKNKLNNKDFRELLKKNSDMFERVRYFHEPRTDNQNKSYDLDFIEAMMFALTYHSDEYRSYVDLQCDKNELENNKSTTFQDIFKLILANRLDKTIDYTKEMFLNIGAEVYGEIVEIKNWTYLDLLRFFNLLVDEDIYSKKRIQDIILEIEFNTDLTELPDFIG